LEGKGKKIKICFERNFSKKKKENLEIERTNNIRGKCVERKRGNFVVEQEPTELKKEKKERKKKEKKKKMGVNGTFPVFRYFLEFEKFSEPSWKVNSASKRRTHLPKIKINKIRKNQKKKKILFSSLFPISPSLFPIPPSLFPISEFFLRNFP